MDFKHITTTKEKEAANKSFDKAIKSANEIIAKLENETSEKLKKDNTKVVVEFLLKSIVTRDHYFETKEILRGWGIKENVITKYFNDFEAVSKFGHVPANITDAVDLYFDYHDIDVTLKNIITTNNNMDQLDHIGENPTEYDKVFHAMQKSKNTLDSIYRDFIIAISESSSVKTSKDVMIATWQRKLDKMQSENFLELFSNISGEYIGDQPNIPIHGRGKAELEKFIRAIIDTNQTDFEVAFYSIVSFMWQVKRKLSDQKVTNHLMPVLVGPQGGGKTTAISFLLGPVMDSTTTINFKQAGDDRYARIFDSLVLFADEMSFMDKANADNLKNLITSEGVTNRPLHSNNIQMIKMNSTFIGAANKSLAEIFYDDTGMRRFIELACLSKDQAKANWKTIEDIDYEAIWQSVNEFTAVNPITHVLEKVEELQEDIRAVGPIEEWLREQIIDDQFDYGAKYNFKTMFKDYDEYRLEYYPNLPNKLKTFRDKLLALLKKPEYALINVKAPRSKDGQAIYFVHDECRKLAAKYNKTAYDPAKFTPLNIRSNHPRYEYVKQIEALERETMINAEIDAGVGLNSGFTVVDLNEEYEAKQKAAKAERIKALVKVKDAASGAVGTPEGETQPR